MKYLLGSEKDFYDFVEKISKKDKIKIITHTDLDGITSGIFLKKILESKGLRIKSITFLDYGSDVLKNFSEKNGYDYLFMTDWSADNFPEGLDSLRKNGKVMVIDHHPINDSLQDKSNIIKTETFDCTSYCLFNLAKKYIETKDLEGLVCSTMVFDFSFNKEENLNFIKSIYPEITKEKIWESKPALMGKKISEALIYYTPNFKKVYNFVLKGKLKKLEKASRIVDKEVSKWIERYKNESEYFSDQKLHFYYGSPRYGITSAVVSQLSDREFKQDTVILASDIKEKKDFVKLSARNQTGKIDLGKLLKKCISKFENATAGGHVRASAANFPKRYLNDFKKNLLEELGNAE
ncbi:DHHA1 domain protein [uncultured archaeon]|nr:DHHA1 domain protein [uncultured archaeon]